MPRETGEHQGEHDLGPLLPGDEGQPADAVLIAAAGVSDEVPRPHDGGKLGEKDQEHGEGAPADGVVGEALVGLLLDSPGDEEEDPAHRHGQPPEKCTHIPF